MSRCNFSFSLSMVKLTIRLKAKIETCTQLLQYVQYSRINLQ